MFRSNWTILREHLLSLAKVTILWNWSVKVRRYMICGVVATSISGCDVCTAYRVVCDWVAHYTARSAAWNTCDIWMPLKATYVDISKISFRDLSLFYYLADWIEAALTSSDILTFSSVRIRTAYTPNTKLYYQLTYVALGQDFYVRNVTAVPYLRRLFAGLSPLRLVLYPQERECAGSVVHIVVLGSVLLWVLQLFLVSHISTIALYLFIYRPGDRQSVR